VNFANIFPIVDIIFPPIIFSNYSALRYNLKKARINWKIQIWLKRKRWNKKLDRTNRAARLIADLTNPSVLSVLLAAADLLFKIPTDHPDAAVWMVGKYLLYIF